MNNTRRNLSPPSGFCSSSLGCNHLAIYDLTKDIKPISLSFPLNWALKGSSVQLNKTYQGTLLFAMIMFTKFCGD